MTVHCARDCLIRRKSGYKCQKKECLARQTVLQNLLRHNARSLIARRNLKGTNQFEVVAPATKNSIVTSSVRGRQLERSLENHVREKIPLDIRTRRPFRVNGCGGGRNEPIILKKYVDTLKLAKIPLKPKLSLQYEAPIVCKHYYGNPNISDGKILKIWKYHKRNFNLISHEFNRQVARSASNTIDKCLDHGKGHNDVAEYTANICCKIIRNMIDNHTNTSTPEDGHDLAASVCSRIAVKIFSNCKHQDQHLVPENANEQITTHLSTGSTVVNNQQPREESYSNGDSIQDFQTEEAEAGMERDENMADDAFRDVGLSENLASVLTNSHVTGNPIFFVKMDQRELFVDLDPSWRQLPIKCSKNGMRMFGGEWTTFFNKVIEAANPYCVFAFKRNFIKQATSRKRKSAFFNAKGACTIEPCKCSVFLTIKDSSEGKLLLRFTGDVKHKSSVLKSRRITGTERSKIKDEFMNDGIKPSLLYRRKLRSLNSEAYAGGNRSSCGVSAKAVQHISSEANRVKNDASVISGKIRASDNLIRDRNKALYKVMMEKQKILGYVQSNDITNDGMCVILFDEGCVQLYRHISSKDVLYFDATGTIIEKVKGFKRILLYSLTTRAPFGRCPPIPIAEMISSSHTAGSIRRLFSMIREKEKTLYGDNVQPYAIRTDFSGAIIAASILEFNHGMSVRAYIDCCYDVLFGKSSNDFLTLILVCSAHIMKSNAKNVEACALKTTLENRKSIKHLAMRIVGILVNCDDLQTTTKIIKLAYVSFMSQYCTSQLTEALSRLSQIANDFEVTFDDHEDKGLLHEDNGGNFAEHQTDGQLTKSENKFSQLVKDELDGIDLTSTNTDKQNKYYLPSYMKYFLDILLPNVPLWTRLMLNSEKCSLTKNAVAHTQNLIGKRLLDVGNTNAHAENYFTFVKQSFISETVPIDEFIVKHFENVQGLRRQYIDSLRVGSGKDDGKKIIRVKQLQKLERATPRYPSDSCKTYDVGSSCEEEEEEEWRKQPPPKRNYNISGHYSEPPSTPLNFNPTRRKESRTRATNKRKLMSNEDKMRFHVFKVKNWSSVSPKLPSTETCIEELQRRFARLSEAEKRQISTPRPHNRELYCTCQQMYNPSGPSMVQCNICEEWYHSTCINMEEEFLSKIIPRYHCWPCAQSIFEGIAQYLTHSDERLNDSACEGIKKLFEEFESLELDAKQIIRTHEFLPNDNERHLPSLCLLRHNRGIKNEKNNCWLSAVVQVLCGTGLLELLSSYDGSNDLQPITKQLSLCKIRLAKDNKTPLTLKMVQDVAMQLRDGETKCNLFDPRSGHQNDADEFYSSIITYYMEHILNDGIMTDFQFVCLDLRHCLNCKGISGSLHRNTMFSVGVKDSTCELRLSDLIWAQLMGKHSDDAGHKKSVCHPGCDVHSIWDATFIRNYPSVLTIQLKRATWDGNGRIMQTPVVLPLQLDLTIYSATKTGRHYTYTLKAVVSHYAYTSGSGHYATHLFDDKLVYTYDDTSVKTRKIETLLELPTFQKSSHLLFYFLNEDGHYRESMRSAPIMTIAEQRKVEKCWFGLLDPATIQISTADLRTACGGCWLNGAFISQFNHAASLMMEDRKIIALSSTFFNSLCDARLSTSEISHLLAINDLKLYDCIVMPINYRNCHWIAASIYPKARCVLVTNSLRDPSQAKTVFEKLLSFLKLHASLHEQQFYLQDWMLIHPRTLPLQQDSNSCGIFASVNAYNSMLPRFFYVLKHGNLSRFRYWIAHVILSHPNAVPVYTRQPLSYSQERMQDILNEKNKNIIIRDKVPGHGKIGSFFQSLKQFVISRAETLRSTQANREFDESNLEKAAEIAETARDLHLLEASDDSSNDSIYNERLKVEAKLSSLRRLKDHLLQRLVIDKKMCNERYAVLALWGKDKLLTLFQRELDVVSDHLSESDLELLKGALYRLFCDEESDHAYFQIRLPTIKSKRYGFTSTQFIDYIILADALCLDYMDVRNVTYEESVSETCGENGSRLTVYWNHVLCKDTSVTVQRVVDGKYYIQGILNELQDERVNVIVAEVDKNLQPTRKDSEKAMIRGKMKARFSEENSTGQFPTSKCISCQPGDLKCDKLILVAGSESQRGINPAKDILKKTLENILMEVQCNKEISIAMPLLHSFWSSEWKEDIAESQVQFLKCHLRQFKACSLAVIRIVTTDIDEFEVLKNAIFS